MATRGGEPKDKMKITKIPVSPRQVRKTLKKRKEPEKQTMKCKTKIIVIMMIITNYYYYC